MKVHQDAMRSALSKESEDIGRFAGGLTSKIHVKVNSCGQLLKVYLSSDQTHDSQLVYHLFANEKCRYFLADRAYDINLLREELKNSNIEAVIPGKINRLQKIIHNTNLYKSRNIVEHFFQKIKRFRRIATRFDKTSRMYLTGITFVSILLALKL